MTEGRWASTVAGTSNPSSAATDCADKFSAVACLLRGASADNRQAIGTLLGPCSGPAAHECALFDAELLSLGNQALSWFEHCGELCVLEAEHVRLFGGADHVKGITRLSPCAATHLEGSPRAIIERVERLYADLGFEVSPSSGPGCPCHIANELEFVAYCLRTASGGLLPTTDTACRFLADHLFAWGIVFAAALCALADHPVLKFAGRGLEGLLFCEAGAAFREEQLPARQP